MKTYSICGIRFNLSFCYETFLTHNIERYETLCSDDIDATIESKIVEWIEEPEGILIKPNNPWVKRDGVIEYVYAKDSNQSIRALFYHDLDYKKSTILINPSKCKDPAETEYVMMSMIFMEVMIRKGFLSLHASAFSYHNQAVLLSAPSQTGKSTLFRHVQSIYPEAMIINDDKPLIRKEKEMIYVYGTPFSGHQKLNHPIVVPMSALVFLKQGKQNVITPLEPDNILTELIKNMYRPMDDAHWDTMLALLEDIIFHVPIYQMTATNSVEAAITLTSTLFEGEAA